MRASSRTLSPAALPCAPPPVQPQPPLRRKALKHRAHRTRTRMLPTLVPAAQVASRNVGGPNPPPPAWPSALFVLEPSEGLSETLDPAVSGRPGPSEALGRPEVLSADREGCSGCSGDGVIECAGPQISGIMPCEASGNEIPIRLLTPLHGLGGPIGRPESGFPKHVEHVRHMDERSPNV